MQDLYLDPVFYGIGEVTLTGGRPGRVVFPSDDGSVYSAPIRLGTYPLVVFVHGFRPANDGVLCPPDNSHDYRAWLPVLHLLARCGFVVIAPDVHDVLYDPDNAAAVVEEAVQWMHFQWPDRSVLWRPGVFVDPSRRDEQATAADADMRDVSGLGLRQLGEGIGVDATLPGGMTTPVGLAGHSWGVRACARAAVGGNAGARAIASIAGAFDDDSVISAIISAMKPTLMIAGTADLQNASYLTGLWNSLAVPKHQALLQGIGHWDWFGRTSGIQPCDNTAARPECPAGWLTAAELMLTFMTKHLNNRWQLPPNLLGPPGARTPLLPYYQEGDHCALKVRWNDPLASGHEIGDATFGTWDDSFEPW